MNLNESVVSDVCEHMGLATHLETALLTTDEFLTRL